MGDTDKLVYSVTEAAELLSIGRTLVYDLIRDGELPTLKIGHRRLVARRTLKSSCPDARGSTGHCWRPSGEPAVLGGGIGLSGVGSFRLDRLPRAARRRWG